MISASGRDRLSPVDAMFLHLEEDGSAHMHMGGVFLCEGPPPSHREFLAHIGSRLHLVPRYRQRLSFAPLGLGRPTWVDDEAFDLAHHLRRITAPAPGGEALEEAAARIFSEPLDRRRPLWGMDIVDGLGDGRFALVSRTHHSLVDGIGGCDILSAITDDAPGAGPSGPAAAAPPRAGPGAATRLAATVRDQIERPLGLLRDLARAGGEGRRLLLDAARGVLPLAGLVLQGRAPRSALNAPIGPERRYATASLDLAAVKRVRALTGTTVNDVLLSVVAGGLRTLLLRRGTPPRGPLRAFVPVSARPPGAAAQPGNHVSVVFCPLPVDEPDPARRLRAVAAAMGRLKAGGQAVGVRFLMQDLFGLAIPAVAARIVRAELAYRRFNLVVSNTPGPPSPRVLLGRPLRSFCPAIPLAPGQTLSVGLLSYAGTVWVGLLGDAEEARDLPLLARGVVEAFEALAARTGAGAAPAPARDPVKRSPAAARAAAGGGRAAPPP